MVGKSKAGWNRRLFPTILLCATLIIAGLVIYLEHASREYNRIPPVHFDPAHLARVHEVSRIYKISHDPLFPDQLFFACEEGFWMLQEKDYTWKRYGLEHGLPEEAVRSAFVHQGRLFITTGNGMAVLEPSGNRFLPVSATNGMSILAAESFGVTDLFLYAEGRGLFVMHGNSDSLRPAALPGFKIERDVTCLKTMAGRLYICQEGLGVAEYDPEKNRVTRFICSRPLSKRTQFTDLLMHKGRLFAATSDDGLWARRGNTDTLVPVDEFPAKGAYVLSDETDGFWCGTPWGLWRTYDQGGAWMQFVHPEEKKPTDFQVMALCNAGNLLFYGSKETGAGYLNKQGSWQSLRAGLSRPNVAALACVEGRVVTSYGYQGGFLDVFNSASLEYETPLAPEGGPADPNLQCMAVSGKRLFFGGFESFGFYDFATKEYRHYGRGSKLPSGDIVQIADAGQPPCFCASQFGIVEYFPETDSFSILAATQKYRVTCILPEGDSLWYGTLSNGARLYNRKTGAGKELPAIPASSRIVGLARVRQKDAVAGLFAATQNSGCFLMGFAKGEAGLLPVPDSLLSSDNPRDNDIMAMRRIDGEIWLGTRNNGCLIYNPEKAGWTSFTYYDGLISDQVRSFYDDADHVWIGCYGGFNRLDKSYFSEKKR
jgi:hypothetical protein